MLSLLAFELQSRWKAVLGWSIGLIGFGALYIVAYDQAADEMASLADIPIYQAMGVELGTFESFMGSVLILFLPLLLGIYAIVSGTRTLGGEEDEGTLELLLARPVPRWQIVTAKTVALGVAILAILVLAGLGIAGVYAGYQDVIESSITPMDLFRAILSGWFITMVVAMVSIFLGSTVPSRRIATVIAAAFLIASYFGENISTMASSLEFLKPISIFSYYDTSAAIFTAGVAAGDVLVLSALVIVFFGLTLLGFEYRDVTTGAWPWQRSRVPPES